MAHITGGTVSYGETRKIGEYENKRAEVTLHFANPDGSVVSDGDLEGFHLQAQSQVHKRLGVAEAPSNRSRAGMASRGEKPVEAPNPKVVARLLAAGVPVSTTPVDLTEIDTSHDMGVLTGVAPDITDKDLTDKIMAKNRIGGKQLTLDIRKLIGHYAGDGKPSHDIAKEKRAAFLAELDALKEVK